jgi:N-acetylglutamate synthase-like GNAT family acetyltransferase
MKIREATTEDIDRIIEFYRKWIDVDEVYGLTLPTHEYFKNRIGQYFLIAEELGSIIGFACGSIKLNTDFCVFDKNCKYLEIEDLYVLPDFRHKNIGGHFIETLIQNAKSNEIDRYLIYSSVIDIDPVVKFYKTHGFKSWAVQMFRDDTKSNKF